MFIRCRPACLHDLDECLAKIRDYDRHTDATREALLQMWRTLLTIGAANFALIEDSDAPAGQRIVWFSFKVFVTDTYLHTMRTQTFPCLSLQILGDWQNERTALLDAAGLRRANSRQGLNIVTLNYGMPRHWLCGAGRDWATSKSVEWSWYSAGGYKAKSLYLEVYGEYEWMWAQGFGLRLQNDYAGLEDGPPADLPRLYGIDREEAGQCAGTQMSVLFRCHPPCFMFKPPEQEMLLWAMMDVTDDELAEYLHLATVTIKKRWQSIYQQVAALAPHLLGDTCEARRGAEKKRRLLNYLRHHMEELRPIECSHREG